MVKILSSFVSLKNTGTSVWLDDLSRALLDSGELENAIAHGVTGVTTNPSIFAKALIKHRESYAAQLAELKDTPLTEKVWELLIADVQTACDLLQPVFQETGGTDGMVSVELDPCLSFDAEKSIQQADYLWNRIGRKNLMIKVPATEAGITVIPELIARGMSVNVTLIFSHRVFAKVYDAFADGLARAIENGVNPARINLVASAFVSRFDSYEVSAPLPDIADGSLGVLSALACAAYSATALVEDKWIALLAQGAKAPRPLWASTSTKKPELAPDFYCAALAGTGCVNTMPRKTMSALIDGDAEFENRLAGLDFQALAQALETATDGKYDAICQELLDNGLSAFIASWIDLFAAASEKTATVTAKNPGDHLEKLIADDFIVKLKNHDATLWGPDAAAEAAIRLGWLDVFNFAGNVLRQAFDAKNTFETAGITSWILCGMGGSSLAPEVITKAHGVSLTVLDSTHPDAILRHLDQDLSTIGIIVSSKSGTTLETSSQRDAFAAELTNQGLKLSEHMMVITDPGSALATWADVHSVTKVLADPNVGGRFSALTAFGLVPSVLAGVVPTRMLAHARNALASCLENSLHNPALQLASALSDESSYLCFTHDASGAGLGAWIEQLVAESTGKDGKGVLPIETDVRVSQDLPHSLTVTAGIDTVADSDVSVAAPLGTQLVLWEIATAALGYTLGMDPFNQPDVESVKIATRKLLADGDSVQHDGLEKLTGSAIIADHFKAKSPEYIAILTFAEKTAELHKRLTALQDELSEALQIPVSLGYGPRYMHSTGQFHKGGKRTGGFIVLLDEPLADTAIPGTDLTFGKVVTAQALGDAQVLAERGFPVLTYGL